MLLERELREYIHRYDLIHHGEEIIIAVSGGIDSMVLLDLLDNLKNEFTLRLAVAHVNHQLRGKESDDDEAFVERAAQARNIPIYIERVDTILVAEERGLSLQEAARDLRLDFFNKIRTSLGFHKIATAHHADDNAETLLFNFIRGAGIEGLSGIPNHRRDLSLIRPLLFATREQIAAYAKTHRVEFREDSSNEKQKYTRNFLRHTVIPQLRDNINPNLAASLRRTGEIFTELGQYVELESRKILPEIVREQSADRVVLDLGALRRQPVFMQEYILLQTSRSFIHSAVSSSTVHAILNITNSETGASCSIGNDAFVRRNRDELIFHRQRLAGHFLYHVDVDKSYSFDKFSFTSSATQHADFTGNRNIEYIDSQGLKFPLTIRSWKEGDVFVPLGMHAEKKVSDFFIDEKVPFLEKREIPLLLSGNTVVWVCGKRLDDRWKVTPATSHILKIEYSPRT